MGVGERLGRGVYALKFLQGAAQCAELVQQGVVVAVERAECGLGELQQARGVAGAVMLGLDLGFLVGAELGGGDLVDLVAEQVELLRVSLLVHDECGFLLLQRGAAADEFDEGGDLRLQSTEGIEDGELLARVRAVLRRHGEPEELLPMTAESGPVRIDSDRHVVTIRGEAIAMPLKEFDLLEFLVRNSGRVLTRSQLIDRVWGSDYVGDTKTLEVHVKRLRAKVEVDSANPVHLLTVRGLGYKYEA